MLMLYSSHNSAATTTTSAWKGLGRGGAQAMVCLFFLCLEGVCLLDIPKLKYEGPCEDGLGCGGSVKVSI